MEEFCVCPGKRNAPLIQALAQYPELEQHHWYEERSAAFFALGRARRTGRPVAVVTTSGTAAGELLPAAMEAHYSGAALLLITADRPRRFRGSGAPQSANQVGIYSNFTSFEQDLEEGEACGLQHWNKRDPAHLNICFEEPKSTFDCRLPPLKRERGCYAAPLPVDLESLQEFHSFLESAKRPLVALGTLAEEARQPVLDFLLKLQAPVYCEAVSGLREREELGILRVRDTEGLWEQPIDAILRIGGVPTFRGWRDLEDMQGKIAVCSVSEAPFSGLSWGSAIQTSLKDFFPKTAAGKTFKWSPCFADPTELFAKYPKAEPSLIHELSKIIPKNSRVYLGNSLPIREWDLAAAGNAASDVWASRGLNGIDGQLSTFFGLCDPEKENWAIVGDLTALYDLSAPWILSEMRDYRVKIVVVNNGGGMIFSRLKMGEKFLHRHSYDFSHFAKMWGLGYEAWMSVPKTIDCQRQSLIELKPHEQETEKFWRSYRDLCASRLLGTA